MKPRQNYSMGLFPAPGRATTDSWVRSLTVCAALAVAVACPGCCESPGQPASEKDADLPEISVFQTKPSDRFLVDIKEITGGHPYLGVDSPHPHAGAHVHFDNTKNRWPKGKDEPANYPAIYAVADGIVCRIDTHFPLNGGNHRYGLDLTFAHDGKGAKYRFCYSIEPMIRNRPRVSTRSSCWFVRASGCGKVT